jgi:hypothetical protein
LGYIDRHIGAEPVGRREYGNEPDDTDVSDRELVPACGILGFGEKLIAHSPLVKGADLAVRRGNQGRRGEAFLGGIHNTDICIGSRERIQVYKL